MNRLESNLETSEEEVGTATSPFVLPTALKWVVSTIAVVFLALCIAFFSMYLKDPTRFASPSELGLTPIFLFSISALFVVWMPWQRLGLRITKLGGVEFQQVVAGQASEHAEDISNLEYRIQALEENIRKKDELADITERFQEPELKRLLLDFLTKQKGVPFSPVRILAWGAKQHGFSDLATYDYTFVRSTLQKMVAEGVLETRVSKKGNTLYRVPLP